MTHDISNISGTNNFAQGLQQQSISIKENCSTVQQNTSINYESMYVPLRPLDQLIHKTILLASKKLWVLQ